MRDVNALEITPGLLRRFWKKVTKTDTCWIFTTPNDNQYGQMGVYGAGVANEKAHRLSWVIHHGKIPNGMFVLHTCDFKPCINPAHLFPGTQTDNMRDMRRKGRGKKPCDAARGEDNGRAKLSEDNVREIISMLLRGDRVMVIANIFGVERSNIGDIRRKKNWKHLTNDITFPLR